jgi:uncharacterized protein (TIGR03083 family)
MLGVEISEHVDQLDRDGGLLVSAASSAGWDTLVPSLAWTARELVTHVGGVHRWAAAIVRTAAATHDVPEGEAVGQGPDDSELIEWFVDGHNALVATLRAASPQLACFTFLPAPSPLAFWARRQAHETAIHRADAEAAAGTHTAFEATFAQDGVAELLLGFAARRSNAITRPGVLALRADDGPHWRVEFGGERNIAKTVEAPDADAVVAGSSDEIYRWLWNRPSSATVTGDPTLAAAWRNVRVTWS